MPKPLPSGIPIRIPSVVKIKVSLFTYKCTSLSKNPSTLIVANSRSRSEIFVVDNVNNTTKTISKLKKGSYKVQVCATLKKGKKIANSKWTTVKNIKVK